MAVEEIHTEARVFQLNYKFINNQEDLEAFNVKKKFFKRKEKFSQSTKAFLPGKETEAQ